MPIPKMLLYVLTMATVTYIIRMIPLVFFKKKITSKFVRSFFYYIPYAVLSAMTIPYVFYSTGDTLSAVIGTAVAFVSAIISRSLLLVAILSVLAVILVAVLI
jgi:branched-subunit amino acid transport protein